MKRYILILAAVLIACGPAGAQNVRRDAAGFPAPDRPVAEIVSPIWATEEERDAVRETEQVFAAVGLKPGMTVADIGAGSGYYVVRLSRAVGRDGRVYGQDVMPDYLKGLQDRVRGLRLANVVTVLGAPDDPKLPDASLDMAFLIHMYHEIEQPYGLLHRLAKSFRRGGKLVVTDLDRRPENHGTPPALLKCEIEAVGYRQVSTQALRGGVGYLAVFEPPAPDKLPPPNRIMPCKG